MSDDRTVRWGDWIWARAVAVGYPTKTSLAKQIGCTKDQVSRWLAMDRPPALRRGFDVRLMEALKVSRHTLFFGYADADPSGIYEETASEAESRSAILSATLQLQGEKLRALRAAADGLLSGSAA